MMKEDWTPIDFGQTEDTTKNIIKVIGVGGGGCNAVKNMYAEGIVNVSFAVCNTDSQSLSKSPVPVKIMLGKSGLGAGANPEVGRSEAQNTQEDIKKLLDDGTKMVFVTAGMGGGTGTGAAPVIAGIAKGMGILTVGIITIPFYFEKRKKIVKALQGVEEMRKNVDALLIVNNERLCDVYADSEITVKDAFKLADKVLSDATKSISELITVEGTINLDFRDIETTIKSGGGAIMAMGRASGEGRVQSAIKNALDSPLLYGSDISNAQRILFNIYTSSKHPIFVREMREIDAFFDELNPDIKVIWGLSDDDSLDEDAKVTILATGLNNELAEDIPESSSVSKDEEDYQRIIDKLYHPIRDNFQMLANKTGQKQEAESIDNINHDATEKEATIAHQEEESGNESGEEPAKVWVEDNPPTAENSREVLAEPPVNKPKAWTLGGRIKNGLKKIAEDLDIITYDDENYK
ncbi:cell division protein FtsZ [Prevotella copri]|jgi:cell division protein FtsZ|uniref:Cell division protein FtsZ n=1 Tax=Segatella copri TaxID=165179 RepID=A0AAW4N1M2_9BACT|nr:cell division protein FtsZ [Segatella copri]MBU9908040.1 cell division protein FtsZ [Segatella copri]MBV3373486.1 cell division protein FtsZ [Segatella copri]MBV3387683.1 cell division protein FtsZ [Segatella copri]MBV3395532.1 cell division protein FtsZ [Segatella copri]MBV3405101.1 cell division protein FtsZ [Segatella copri]